MDGRSRWRPASAGPAAACVATLLSAQAIADTIRVPEDVPRIQDAIDAAEDGDDVLVAPGRYRGFTTRGKAITVHSVGGPEVTTLVGGCCTVITCALEEGPDTVISGFTVLDGRGSVDGGGAYIVDSSPTITDCNVSGAFEQIGARPITSTLVDCTFTDNGGRNHGAVRELGVIEPLRLVGCTFVANETARGGAAVGVYGAGVEAEHCVFRDNVAGEEGGAWLGFAGDSRVTGCTFEGNVAAAGGAIFDRDGHDLFIRKTTFCRNEPDDIDGTWTDGGGNVFCCVGDVDESGVVDFGDVVRVLGAWGECEACPEDVDDDGRVDFADLLLVLGSWGRCG